MVTSFIKEAIQERLRDPACPRWCCRYAVQENPPVEYEGRAGKSKLRPDMIIEGTFKGRPEYVFEAKRLRKSRPDVRQYLGRKGMGCFVRGVYAPRYDEAAMLGYVQSHSVSHWRSELQGGINRAAKAVALRSPQADVADIEVFHHVWISDHERPSVGRSITLWHILLDCLPCRVVTTAT